MALHGEPADGRPGIGYVAHTGAKEGAARIGAGLLATTGVALLRRRHNGRG